MKLWVVCAALSVLVAAPAASAELSGTPVLYSGPTMDDEDVDRSISGMACLGDVNDISRACIVALDEGLSAQSATLSWSSPPSIVFGSRIDLLQKDTNPNILPGADRQGDSPLPKGHCSEGAGKFNENDTEGATVLNGAYYLTASHGCGRHSDKLKLSSFIDTRVDAAGAVIATFRLNPTLASLSALHDAFARDIDDGAGLSIEGIAGAGSTLYFGLRSPLIDGNPVLVPVPAADLFMDGGAIFSDLIKVPITGSSIRDLATLDETPVRLLILTGDAAGEGDGASIVLFTPGQPASAVKLADLAPIPGEKAEGLVIAHRDAGTVSVIVLHDGPAEGIPNHGDPLLFTLDIPPP